MKCLCIASALLMLALTLFAICFASQKKASAQTVEDIVSFHGITATNEYVVPEDKNISDGRKGVLISSDREGDSIKFRTKISGVFEMDFRVFSQSNFNKKNLELSTEQDAFYNANNDLQELAFTFKNSDGNQFDLILSGGTWENIATVYARVEARGRSAGVYYYKDKQMTENTFGANANGLFTSLWGTSFCNAGYTNGNTPLASPISSVIGFDPTTMEVYAKCLDYLGNETKRIIWDFSDSTFDGQDLGTSLNSFKEYSVSVTFASIAEGRTANMVIYSVNGQNTDAQTLVNSSGPSVMPNFEKSGVAGEKYFIPYPSVYDVLDGHILFNGTLRITCDGSEYDMFTSKGDKTNVLLEGCYFIPDKAGTYIFEYAPVDFHGLSQVSTAELNVFETRPQTGFTVSGLTEESEVGVGYVLTVPAATAKNSVYTDGRVLPVTFDVLYNGTVMEGYGDIVADKDYQVELQQAGTYSLRYKCADTGDVYIKTIEVSGDLPVFSMSAGVPGSLSIGDTLIVPDCTVKRNGASVNASFKVYFPDGACYQSRKIIIPEPGVYTVEYTGTVDGETYCKRFTITVKNPIEDSFENVNGTRVENGVRSELGNMTGSRITVSRLNSSARYTRTVYVGDNTKEDVLIELFPEPAVWSQPGLSSFSVYLTDIHNPDNYVEVKLNYGFDRETSIVYYKAGANGQPLTGYDGATVHMNGRYGTPMVTLWSGLSFSYWEQAKLSDITAKIYYDNAERAFYVTTGNTKKLITDLDSFEDWDKWNGFTTGEVELSVYFQNTGDNIDSSGAKLFVTQIDGNAIGAEYPEVTAPVI